MRHLWLLAGLLSLVTTSAFAAGTVPGFNLTPQFDLSGKLAPGCKLYVIQAGTTSTPQNAYQDTGLTQVLPNPITCDAAGRVPQWFVADGTIKLRLTTSAGTQIFVGDNLLVVGPSSGGGGGGGTVDPTTILSTGDIKSVYGTTVLSGWVRLNGRTIGSASSGATERANADTQALFEYLWGADASLTVSGGRGASAAADWAANKTIALPDFRGRVMAGFDDMGSTAAGRLTAATMTGTGIGSVSTQSERMTLGTTNLPAQTPSGSVSLSTIGIRTRAGSAIASNDPNSVFEGNSSNTLSNPNNGPIVQPTATFTGTSFAGQNSTPFSIVQPTIFVTTYIKL